ncbi:MAG: DUF4129 domain-containing protein [Chromatiales bacterium]|nr:DUF4129 domain-containing protein [Chromatiales bacterium]
MELDKLEFSLRRRNHWEAIDLGFTLARRWFLPLWALWLATAIPVGILLFVLVGEKAWLLALLLWWLKPLYEPPLLFWMSRAVFGENLTVKAVVRQWWSIVWPQLFANLTWRRLNPNRSFNMPVGLLERLKGKRRRDRIRILGKGQHAAIWLTFVGIHFEAILQFALLIVLYALIPEDLRWIDLEDFLIAEGSIQEWLQLLVSLISMSIIAPFYVASGFVLYLHRRSELEAWDIEINFRRIDERLKKAKHRNAVTSTAVLVLALMFGGLLLPDTGLAVTATTPEQARPIIEEVLADKAFGELEERRYWKYIGETEEEEEIDEDSWFVEFFKWLLDVLAGFFKGFASVGEAVMWIAGTAVVIYLVYHIAKNKGWFSLGRPQRLQNKKAAPVQLFGLDIRPDQLPDDPAAEAKRLVEAGDLRGALSLLYRGALMRLVTEQHIEIPDSATEGECVRLVARHQPAEEAYYFGRLTDDWLKMAYAHIAPQPERLLDLCSQWQGVYGHVEG